MNIRENNSKVQAHLEGENTSIHERALVAAAKSGHSDAFAELYERHRLRVCRCAFRILRNQQDAEDAAQRAFQRAFMNFARFREDSAFSTWVTRIAINEALMMLRHQRASRLIPESNLTDDLAAAVNRDLADERPTPEQILAEAESRAVVMQAISRLRKSLRSVILLREFQGLTSAETARRLGLTVSAVKARAFHAKRYLRRHLERKYKFGRRALLIPSSPNCSATTC